MQGDRLAAHYRVTTEGDGRRRLVSFATSDSTVFSSSAITFYEFDESGALLHMCGLPRPLQFMNSIPWVTDYEQYATV